MAAGRHADALQTLAALHELIADPQSPQTAAYNVQDQNFARAKLIESGESVPRRIKESGREINYGSGKPVIEETIADARAPLQINWYGDSYIEVPVIRPGCESGSSRC
jgi:hypothetical protein